MPPEETRERPWYAAGLRFACTRCGNCCTGAAGTVRLSDREIARLAARLELADAEFRTAFTRVLRGGDVSLRERRDGSCVFHDREAGCRVHAERPLQCRTWPFWGSVVHSRERWDEEARECPGMNRGPLQRADVIAARAARDGTGPKPPRRGRRGRARGARA